MKSGVSLIGDAEAVGFVGDSIGLLCWSSIEASETYIDERFMCCIVGGGEVVLMGRTR